MTVTDWRDDPRRACATTPTGLFFSSNSYDGVQAKQICRTCPLVDTCRTHAIKHAERGIWGATTDTERGRIRAAERGVHVVKTPTLDRRQFIAARMAWPTQAVADHLGITVRAVERHKAHLAAEQHQPEQAAA